MIHAHPASGLRKMALKLMYDVQDALTRLAGRVPPQTRVVLVRAAAAARRPDTTVVLGASLAVMGVLYAGAVVRNKQLARALHAKERDMAQLVMKVGPV